MGIDDSLKMAAVVFSAKHAGRKTPCSLATVVALVVINK